MVSSTFKHEVLCVLTRSTRSLSTMSLHLVPRLHDPHKSQPSTQVHLNFHPGSPPPLISPLYHHHHHYHALFSRLITSIHMNARQHTHTHTLTQKQCLRHLQRLRLRHRLCIRYRKDVITVILHSGEFHHYIRPQGTSVSLTTLLSSSSSCIYLLSPASTAFFLFTSHDTLQMDNFFFFPNFTHTTASHGTSVILIHRLSHPTPPLTTLSIFDPGHP